MEAIDEKKFAAARRRLADSLRGHGICDERVLEALRETPRHRFLPRELWADAYMDIPLPIGQNQTISQPWVVARMTELVLARGPSKVLEVGTGSGYQAAVLARLVEKVLSVERIAQFAATAARVWQELALTNIAGLHADGRLGWAPEAPFDTILVTAGASSVPKALLAQLADGGRLVMPVGHRVQRIYVSDCDQGEHSSYTCEAVRFVPLLAGVS